MMDAPDNYSQWESHEQQQEAWLQKRPVCADCDEHIQDESAFYINGEWVCERCIGIYRRGVIDE